MKKIFAVIFFAVCLICLLPIAGQSAMLDPPISHVGTSIDQVLEKPISFTGTEDPIPFMANETVNVETTIIHPEDAVEMAKKTEDGIKDGKEVQEQNKTFTATISTI